MEPIIATMAGAILTRCVDPIIGKVTSLSKGKFEEVKISTGMAFGDYLEKAQEKYSRIKTLLYRTEPKYIYDFFVIPKLKKQNDEIIIASSVEEILNVSHFIIIKGTGGIGKSTLMKHLFLNTIKLKRLIPIFFDLKDINNLNSDYKIEDIIFSKLQNLGGAIEKEYLGYALQSGCFAFFFDGYDEIITDKKGYFFLEFDTFCDRYSKNFFIISSRPYSDFIEFTRFTLLDTMPFDKKDALSLINKMDYDRDIKERFLVELDNGLYDKHESFASNPLLLNIMLLNFDNYAEIPEKMHVFYNQAFETLYHRHDSTKAGYKRELKCKLSDDGFKSILSYFCYITYANGLFEFSDEQIKGLFNRIIRLDRLKEWKNSFCTNDYIDDLTNALCLIYKDGDKYVFSHRSFQEYFTAVFLKELSDDEFQKMGLHILERDYIRVAHDSVFFLLMDMAKERFEINILLPILTEFETGHCDKIKWYLSNIAKKILVRKNISTEIGNKKTSDYSLAIKSSTVHVLTFFLRNMGLVYLNTNKKSNIAKKTGEEKLVQYLMKAQKKNLEISYDEYSRDPILFNLVLNTWIGDLGRILGGLGEQITDRQNNHEEIFDLLK